MVTPLQKARILQLRGLGYSRNEIVKQLNLTAGQLRYWTRKIEKQARENGPDETYIQLMTDGITPEIVNFIQLAKKLGR